MNTVISMPAMPLFPPRSRVMMLSFTEVGQMTSGTVQAGSYVFSANGLYDPNITSTGAQPAGFDQMMVFYEHYTVLRAKIRVVYKNQSTTLFESVSLAARADPTPVTDIPTIMESGNAQYTKLAVNPATGCMKELSMSVDIAKFSGIPDLLDNSECRGSVASNPTEQTYFHVSVWNSETVGTVTCFFELRIEYYVVFSEPRVVVPSLLKPLISTLRSLELKTK